MSSPTQNEIRNQLLILVALAAVALSAAKFFANTVGETTPSAPSSGPIFRPIIEDVQVGNSPVNWPVNWDDINLQTGRTEDPEMTVKTARGKMLSDFEAR